MPASWFIHIFFSQQYLPFCFYLAVTDVGNIAAYLANGVQFGNIIGLGKQVGHLTKRVAKADYITKLHAICQVCGNIANISYRKVKTEGQVLLGEKDVYEPRCRHCAQLKDWHFKKLQWSQEYLRFCKKMFCLNSGRSILFMVYCYTLPLPFLYFIYLSTGPMPMYGTAYSGPFNCLFV